MNLIDRFLSDVETGLRTVFASPIAQRASPANSVASSPSATSAALPAPERVEACRLMRVNHSGEVCAQALYQGQSLFARQASTRALLQQAAGEERDHLAWCAERVNQLGGRTSVLNPAFFAGSFALGVVSGLAGDRWSLGFLVETERQVEAHLDRHLACLDARDVSSRAIVEQMRADEVAHGNAGESKGGAPLPPPIRAAMRVASKVMTTTTYWV